jgi:hypothetical protein
MIFKKTIHTAVKKKCTLLYLMGMTWHTKCMFDLDCDEPSFCDILNGYGIETYAFDNSKNDHSDTVNTAIQLIREHEIDYIFAYSYGCRVVMDLLHSVDVKGIMLLDPIHVPNVQVPTEKTPMGSVVRKSDIDSVLTANSAQITTHMRAAHIAAVSDTDTLTIPTYMDRVLETNPSPYEGQLSSLFARPCRLFLTRHCSQMVRQWRPEATTLYPNSSHWIMIEPGRYQLAEDVYRFVSRV